jgi:hypothetical protein
MIRTRLKEADHSNDSIDNAAYELPQSGYRRRKLKDKSTCILKYVITTPSLYFITVAILGFALLGILIFITTSGNRNISFHLPLTDANKLTETIPTEIGLMTSLQGIHWCKCFQNNAVRMRILFVRFCHCSLTTYIISSAPYR